MAAKTITIKKSVYDGLLKIKKSNESFSDLFERLMQSINPIDILKELRETTTIKDKRRMLAEIRTRRSERRI